MEHSGARVLVYDAELGEVARAVAEGLAGEPGRDVRLVEAGPDGSAYERLLAGSPEARVPVADERGLLAINYTSGTTGRPKGVMYHHRGAYLQALSVALHARLDLGSVFLWTLPMFHCNGWCFTWGSRRRVGASLPAQGRPGGGVGGDPGGGGDAFQRRPRC